MAVTLQRRDVMRTGNGAHPGGPTFALFSSTPGTPHKANVPATPAATAWPATPAAATPEEPHPQIREALAALRHAREHLEHAAHDFGGHRVEALKATDEAIRQLEMCLKYDKD